MGKRALLNFGFVQVSLLLLLLLLVEGGEGGNI